MGTDQLKAFDTDKNNLNPLIPELNCGALDLNHFIIFMWSKYQLIIFQLFRGPEGTPRENLLPNGSKSTTITMIEKSLLFDPKFNFKMIKTASIMLAND